MRWLDAQLAITWDELEAKGLLDDTLVVVWTDHGEQFYERGHQTHAYQLFAEEVDGYAMFWAANLKPGLWTEPTTAIDLAPTILDALSVPIPDLVTGEVAGTADPMRPRYATTTARLGGISSVERGGLELMFEWDGGLQAFDRHIDPAQQVDILDLNDPAQAELWELLRERVEAESALAPHLEAVSYTHLTLPTIYSV